MSTKGRFGYMKDGKFADGVFSASDSYPSSLGEVIIENLMNLSKPRRKNLFLKVLEFVNENTLSDEAWKSLRNATDKFIDYTDYNLLFNSKERFKVISEKQMGFGYAYTYSVDSDNLLFHVNGDYVGSLNFGNFKKDSKKMIAEMHIMFKEYFGE